MKRLILLFVALLMSFGLFFSTASAQAEPSKADKDKEKTYLIGFKNFGKGHEKAKDRGEMKRKYKHLPFLYLRRRRQPHW